MSPMRLVRNTDRSPEEGAYLAGLIRKSRASNRIRRVDRSDKGRRFSPDLAPCGGS